MAILSPKRTFSRLFALAFFSIVVTYLFLQGAPYCVDFAPLPYRPSSFDWVNRTLAHPLEPSEIVWPPKDNPRRLRRIQHDFSKDPRDEQHERAQAERRVAVRRVAARAWRSYREFAWGHDELKPLERVGVDPFAGWGATLVDSLDTLWLMGLRREFREAVKATGLIDWDGTTSPTCSVFETNIRFLGGLLSAYDLSGHPTLLKKAVELGNMLFAAFDTPNHLPAQTFHFGHAKDGRLLAGKQASLATTGTMSMEFTRLTQLTGDPKFYSVIDRIKHELSRTQNTTKLPGLWPKYIDLRNGFLVSHHEFSLGSSADSGFEYLPKMYALLGGLDDTYAVMHRVSMEAARKHLLFRPMLPRNPDGSTPDVLFPGATASNGKVVDLTPSVQHLACFAGGHYALGGRLLGLDDHVEIGEQLARGCGWAYSATPTGIMPELSQLVPCETDDLAPCEWDDAKWNKHGRRHLPEGFDMIQEPRYMLRPEAIESIFILYRITGKRDLLDIAWDMFRSIERATGTQAANSAITSVMEEGDTSKSDNMESFWIGETLKYFYLIFSDPDIISLDDYVFNTEAHPFKIPKPRVEKHNVQQQPEA